MIVRNVVSGQSGDTHQLSADVTFENPSAKSVRIWFRFPGDLGAPPVLADSYLAGLLVPSMVLEEDLRIEAPISCCLLEAVRDRLTPIMRRWGWDRRQIAIDCDEVANPLTRHDSRNTGCFFSGGVDSWYTALKNRDCFSDLIYIHGFEIDLESRALWDAAVKLNEAAARDLGKALVLVSTNLLDRAVHEVTSRLQELGRPRRYFSNDCYFGSMLVAVGLCLQRAFRRVIIPASWPYEHFEPNGSHPLMEPNWSTDSVEFSLDGCEASRIDKIRALKKKPDALRRLRVCVEDVGDQLNCGLCWKCTRTQLEMRVGGAYPFADAFRHRLDLGEAKLLRPPVDPFMWSDLLREAVAAGDIEVADTVRILLGEKIYWPRLREDLAAITSKRSRREAKRWLKKRLFGREPRSRSKVPT